MKILSLFDGMACGHIAFTQLGGGIECYKAYEIDKYAIKVAQHNFPDIEELGDVFKADFNQYNDFDWLIGGSPCTYWSIAQSPDKRETTSSGLGWDLFSQYVRALREAKPKFFLYENNKSMSKEIRAAISKEFGFEPICINSALVSAQNRQRLYWVGIRQKDGSYKKADIEQPKDRNVVINDIIEGEHYGLWSDYNRVIYKDKARCVGTGIAVQRSTTNQQVITKNVSIKKPNKKGGQKERCYIINGIEDSVRQYIREMSVKEVSRLQTVPDWYKFPVSNSQAYKMLGNGWTVEVIKHLIKSAIENDIDK